MARLTVRAVLVGTVIGLSLGCGKKPDDTAGGAPGTPTPAATGDGKAPAAAPTAGTAPGTAPRTDAPTVPDAFGDPLPPGAVLRLGTERGKPGKGWSAARLLPDGKRVLAPHNHRQLAKVISLEYSLYDVNGLTPVGEPVRAEVNPRDEFRGAFAVSADGRRIAGINVKDIDVLDPATGKRVLNIPISPAATNSVSLSADGKLLAVGGSSKSRPGDGPVTCAVWDVDAGKEVARVTVLQNSTATGLLSPDGKTLITSGSHSDPKLFGKPDNPDTVTQLWDVASKAELGRANWKGREVTFSPDSKVVAVVAQSPPQVLLADPRTGKTVHTLDAPNGGTGPAAFTPDGKVLAVVGREATTRWDVATGRVVGSTPRPAELPAGVVAARAAFDGPDRLVAFGYQHLAAYTWDALAGKLLSPTNTGHAGRVRSVAFTPDGREIRSAGADGAIHRWDAATGKPLGQVELRTAGGSAPPDADLAADGGRAVAGVTVHGLPDGKPVGDFAAAIKPDFFAAGKFPTPDGAYLAVFGPLHYDKPARCFVYDVAAGKKLGEVSLPAGLIRAAAVLSPDRKRLVTAVSTKLVGNSSDVLVTGWEVATGKKLGEAKLAGAGAVMGLVPAGDRQAVVATGMGKVAVIDAEAGTVVREVEDPTRLACQAVTVSRDGKLLAVAQTGRPPAAPYTLAVRVYDLATGAPRHTIISMTPRGDRNAGVLADSVALMNQASPPEVMAFSPDGTRLATPALTSVLVWDLSRIDADGGVK